MGVAVAHRLNARAIVPGTALEFKAQLLSALRGKHCQPRTGWATV